MSRGSLPYLFGGMISRPIEASDECSRSILTILPIRIMATASLGDLRRRVEVHELAVDLNRQRVPAVNLVVCVVDSCADAVNLTVQVCIELARTAVTESVVAMAGLALW
jgi:hypothetical protein